MNEPKLRAIAPTVPLQLLSPALALMEAALTLLTVIATLAVGILCAGVAQPHLLEHLVAVQAQAH
jgi:hypothetical protein